MKNFQEIVSEMRALKLMSNCLDYSIILDKMWELRQESSKEYWEAMMEIGIENL